MASQTDHRELVLSEIPTEDPKPGVPKLRLPFRMIRSGQKVRAATVEQGTPDDIVQCVWVVLATDFGSRVELAEFGNPDQTFTDDYDLGLVREAIERDEPRAAHLEEAVLDEVIERVRVEAT